METSSPSGRWFARITYVKSALVGIMTTPQHRLFRGRKGKHVRHLSDHLARDIGLGPAEMERHRHVWPSQSADRPRI